MQSTFKIEESKKVIRRWLAFFMTMLAISGIIAMPLQQELSIAIKLFDQNSFIGSWLRDVHYAVKDTTRKYPYLFYGFDSLGFAHIVVALAFIGPYKDPVKNKWVIEFGSIACLLIIPFALLAGHIRAVPILWRLIDCSFGILGLIPLGICYNKIIELESLEGAGDKRFEEYNKLISQINKDHETNMV